MKIFVINLPSSIDRKKFMVDQLKEMNLDYELIEAIDGRTLSENDLSEQCDMNQLKAWPELLTPGMIGCSLSHYKIYCKMVHEQVPFAVILEDDTLLLKDFSTVVQLIETKLVNRQLSKDEPILLYYQSKERVTFAGSSGIMLNDIHSIYYPVDIWRPITTAAYVVTLECAKRLRELVFPIKYSPDSWAVFHREGAIEGLRCVLPLPVQSGYFKSDIGYELHKPLNRFVKSLETKNIFPIKQLLKLRRRRLAVKLNRYTIVNKPTNWKNTPLSKQAFERL